MLLHCYVGDGVAHRVVKGYIGVNGKARKIYEPIYIKTETIKTTVSGFSNSKEGYAATTVGDYALFAGGYYGSNATETYTSSLVKSTTTALGGGFREGVAATTVGSYALFGGGGHPSTYSDDTNVVDRYNSNLVKSTATPLSEAKKYTNATTVGNYALFAGGLYNGSASNTVDRYNSNLVKSTATPLSEGGRGSAVTVGDYALFGGKIVDAYNVNLVKSIAAPLSEVRSGPSSTTAGNYALFGGGYNGSYSYTSRARSIVDTYDVNLVKSTATSLTKGSCSLASATVGGCALFGGGSYYNSGGATNYLLEVNKYDINLVREIVSNNLSVRRHRLVATSIGDYVLFGGGLSSDSGAGTAVDAYEVRELYK